jgi:hypothetical protein
LKTIEVTGTTAVTRKQSIQWSPNRTAHCSSPEQCAVEFRGSVVLRRRPARSIRLKHFLHLGE